MKTNLPKLFGTLILVVLAGFLWAQQPTIIPAALRNVTPSGVMRGQTVTLTLEGVNLNEATTVFFDDPGITGSVIQNPKSKIQNQIKVEMTIAPNVRVGIHRMFAQTPLGTTGAVTFAVGGWTEISEKQPNDAFNKAQRIALPCTVVGALDQIGDTDYFSFDAKAGREIVFEVVASQIRSKLNSVLTLMDADGKILAENNDADGRVDSVLGYKFTRDGTYVIRLRDFENAGGADVSYRLNVGEFAYVTEVFPLGVPKGATTEVTVQGFNLSESAKSVGEIKVTVQSPEQTEWGKTIRLPVESLNEVKLAVGDFPEVIETDDNRDLAHAQRINVPVTVNGRVSNHLTPRLPNHPTADFYRFPAKKGQTLVLEVMARRLGSPLDSVIDVLNAQGNPIERATLRPVAETYLVLSDRDSAATGFRIQSWTDFAINDFLYCGGEVVQATQLPLGPDEDIRLRNFRGQRVTFLDTTPTAHAVNASVYKVQIHPPGKTFPPNGMPIFRVNYSNDDGGPLYGKDSRLFFTAPADGDYGVRIRDARGAQVGNGRRAVPKGERHGVRSLPYRLTIREPQPDFRLTMTPEHPNVPRGASATVTVTAERRDNFDGEIAVKLEGLPEGFSATQGIIERGETSCILSITADEKTKDERRKTPLIIAGRANVAGKEIVRTLEPDPTFGGVRLLTVTPKPDITVTTNVRDVTIQPGRQAVVTVKVDRHNGFAGRVPIDVRNLPFGVRVLDVGLNGVLVTEADTSRQFVIYCEPWVKPQTRTFYCVGRVESDPQAEEASPPLTLKIAPRAISSAK